MCNTQYLNTPSILRSKLCWPTPHGALWFVNICRWMPSHPLLRVKILHCHMWLPHMPTKLNFQSLWKCMRAPSKGCGHVSESYALGLNLPSHCTCAFIQNFAGIIIQLASTGARVWSHNRPYGFPKATCHLTLSLSSVFIFKPNK